MTTAVRPNLARSLAIVLFSVLAGLGVPKSVIAEPAPTYLALGDSLAYGLQIGKLKGQIAEGAVRPESFDTGYVDVLAADLKRSAPGLTVVNLGCPGESTTSFIAGPCGFATTGKPFGTAPLPLHVPYQARSLPRRPRILPPIPEPSARSLSTSASTTYAPSKRPAPIRAPTASRPAGRRRSREPRPTSS